MKLAVVPQDGVLQAIQLAQDEIDRAAGANVLSPGQAFLQITKQSSVGLAQRVLMGDG